MSKPFLQSVAEDFYQNQFKKYNKPVLIFPNKRMIAYFRKYFAQAVGKSEFSPYILTIESFVQQILKLTVPDKLILLFRLYDAYKKVLGDKAQSLSEFYNFGDTLLSDFNELDSYLIDIKSLFTNIKDLAEISDVHDYLSDEQIEILQKFWAHFQSEGMSGQKAKFLLLWEKIPEIYEVFTQSLLHDHLAYDGLQLRKITELIQKGEYHPKYHYFIVGFNALNKAHHSIFGYLAKQNRASLYWDYDAYYSENKAQEAGFFIRQNLKRYKESTIRLADTAKLAENKDNWEVIAVAGDIRQAQIIGQLVHQIPKDKTIGIILGDENLLFPIMNNLPEDIDNFNVTMGYPFQSTFVYQLLVAYFRLHQYGIEFKEEAHFFYPTKLINEILDNPLIKEFETNESLDLQKLIKKAGIIRLAIEKLKEVAHPLFTDFFFVKNTTNDLLNSILNVLYALFSQLKSDEDKQEGVEIEYIIQAHNQLKKLSELLVHEDVDVLLSVKISLQYLANLSVPFSGEKLERIQIMGLMETRSLDFDYLLFADANEGKIPNISQAISFIPQMLRKAFELPVTAYQDSIFAYLFYRLLQRSEKTYILYNSLNSSTSSGELTRYMIQLKYEAGFAHFKNHKINVRPTQKKEINIEKTAKIQNILANYYSDSDKPFKSIFPTFLSVYLKCPLQFYFKYLTKIKPLVEEFKELDYRDIGNILHGVLEDSYQKLVVNNKIWVRKDSLPVLEEGLSELVHEKLMRNHEHGSFEELSGGQKLMAEIIESYCRFVFEYDIKKNAPFEILGMEEDKYSILQEFTHKGKKVICKLSGIFDRIDRVNGITRIIDYKTGEAKMEFSDLYALFERENKKRLEAIFQVLTYGFIFYKNTTIVPETAIYKIRQIAMPKFSPLIKQKINSKEKKACMTELSTDFVFEFEANLVELIEEIFNPDVSFYQTKNELTCTYCLYKVICNRK